MRYEKEIAKARKENPDIPIIKYYPWQDKQRTDQLAANLIRIELTYGKKKALSVKELVKWMGELGRNVTEATLTTLINRSNQIYLKDNLVYVNLGGV